MNILAITVATLFVLVGFYINVGKNIVQTNDNQQEKVLSEENEKKDDENEQNQEIRTAPTQIPEKASIESEEESTASAPDNNLNAFYYPNASVTSTIQSSFMLESTDAPKSITNWYESKIKYYGYSVNSFVKTNTNDNILNKLVGSNGSTKVSIEITKSPQSTTTFVKGELN